MLFRSAPFVCISLVFVFQLANTPDHGPHGAEGTTRPWLVKYHGDEQRSQHEAVKAEGEAEDGSPLSPPRICNRAYSGSSPQNWGQRSGP